MIKKCKSKSFNKILSRNMNKFMRVNRIPDSQLPIMLGPLPFSGYGWNLIGRVVIDNGKTMSLTGKNEFGWAGAASTYFWVDPDEDLVGIMMTQYLGSMRPITDDMRVAMYQAID